MLFRQSQRVVYVRPDSLEICRGQQNECLTLSLPPAVITALEVVDAKSLHNEVTNFLNSSGLDKQKTILVLSPEVVFQATVPANTETHQADVFSFFNNIPFSPENIARKVLNANDVTYLFSTNAELYMELSKAFAKAGWEIEAVVPATMFFEAKGIEGLTPQQVESILRNRGKLALGNFLTDTTQPDNEFEGAGLLPLANRRFAVIALAISLALLVGALVFAFLTLAFGGPAAR